jgi:predicted O-methyltransferase YrrM
MSYHGYIPLLKGHLLNLKHPPSIIEIGVDRGVTLISLAVFLSKQRERFNIIGVDVLVQEQVKIMLANLDLGPEQNVLLAQRNSLELLPELTEAISQKTAPSFDVVLLDGDHNYHTVSRELTHLGGITHVGSIVIIDDYNGRWSERDMWYSERQGYENVSDASKRQDTEKHGVKAAVDEFIDQNADAWATAQPIQGEPIVLVKKK